MVVPPWIELRHWRQFVTVAEELHFGRAAARLNMTQPPLTQAIAQLERSLGVVLFARTKRSVQLTREGFALLAQAQELLQHAQGLAMQAQALAEGELGRLKLAFVSTVGFSLLPPWLMAFRQQYPSVELELIEATGDVQLQMLRSGEVDAGFMLHAVGFTAPGLQQQRVAQEPFVLACPAQHPLAHFETVRLQDVLPQPLVIFPQRIAPSLFDAIAGMYRDAGLPLQVEQQAIQMQTIVNLVSAGLGLAWVPACVRQFQRTGVVYREVKGAVPQCETSLVWQRSSPALTRFMGFASVHNATP